MTSQTDSIYRHQGRRLFSKGLMFSVWFPECYHKIVILVDNSIIFLIIYSILENRIYTHVDIKNCDFSDVTPLNLQKLFLSVLHAVFYKLLLCYAPAAFLGSCHQLNIESPSRPVPLRCRGKSCEIFSKNVRFINRYAKVTHCFICMNSNCFLFMFFS